MTYAVRILKNQLHWVKNRAPGEEWLVPEELRADAFKSLATTSNKLSIYLVDTDEQLRRVLAAYTSTKEKVERVDYALINLATLQDHGLELENAPGETPDPEVSAWHRDLIHLNGTMLHCLAMLIYNHATIHRKLDGYIGKAINEFISSKFIDASKLPSKMIEQLRDARYSPTEAT